MRAVMGQGAADESPGAKRTAHGPTSFERLHATGILRRGSPQSGFRYVFARDGRPARRERARIRSLRLPPAWRDVAIDASPTARLQAVGRDAAGRWRERTTR